MKKQLTTALIVLNILVTTPATYALGGVIKATDESISLRLGKQDCLHYLPEKDYLPTQRSKEKVEKYFNAYFAPWNHFQTIFTTKEAKQYLHKKIQKYRQKPGWACNRHPYKSHEIEALIKQVDIRTFPNQQYPAITLRSTNLRVLPTEAPCFYDWTSAGEGYPFDYWQESRLPSNDPVYVLHTSKRGDWRFVITNQNVMGWIKGIDLACVDQNFIRKWQTGKYVTPNQLNSTLHSSKNRRLIANTRFGQVLPVTKTQCTSYEVFTAMADENGQAQMSHAFIADTQAVTIPLSYTARNIANRCNAVMGEPYDWGDHLGYHDCSSILRNIFAAFAVHLPRNSGDQRDAGTYISMKNWTYQEKEERILKEAIPFKTLIWFPGHVMLYLGISKAALKLHKKDPHLRSRPIQVPLHAHIFDSLWGFKTVEEKSGKVGRAVIGKANIRPIGYTMPYSNIDKTLFEKAQGMVILTD